MSKVIIVSRTFPLSHKRKGEETNFITKILNCLLPWEEVQYEDGEIKSHTIRDGNRWKEGEKASLRYWKGRPYNSKQEEFAEVEIVKVWNIIIEFTPNQATILIPTERPSEFQMLSLGEVAKNDGLTIEDFYSWFNPSHKDFTFEGQIICWDDKIEY